jgi:hypothetical protein
MKLTVRATFQLSLNSSSAAELDQLGRYAGRVMDELINMVLSGDRFITEPAVTMDLAHGVLDVDVQIQADNEPIARRAVLTCVHDALAAAGSTPTTDSVKLTVRRAGSVPALPRQRLGTA